MRFDTQQSRQIGKHRVRIGLGEALATRQVEEDLSMSSTHVRVTFAFSWPVTKITPSVDRLLRRATSARNSTT
jgi:hypothetical protein